MKKLVQKDNRILSLLLGFWTDSSQRSAIVVLCLCVWVEECRYTYIVELCWFICSTTVLLFYFRGIYTFWVGSREEREKYRKECLNYTIGQKSTNHWFFTKPSLAKSMAENLVWLLRWINCPVVNSTYFLANNY